MEAEFNHLIISQEADPSRSEERAGLVGKVLVLNQSYEPISICTPRKAILLLLLGKAEMIAPRADKYIRTSSSKYQFPSIIRLNNFVQVPYRHIEMSRKNIMKRDEYSCQYCGRKGNLTIDHVIPKSRGGPESWENLVAACHPCNSKKGNRTPDEAKMPLLRKPRRPSHIVFFKQFMGSSELEWKQFLFAD